MFDWLKEKTINAYNTVTSTASQWAENVTKVGTQTYEDAKQLVQQNADEVKKKYDEAAFALYELENTRKIVEDTLRRMPEGPDRVKLQAQADEAGTFFNQYVAPLANKLLNDRKTFDRVDVSDIKYSNLAAMGVLPAAAWAAGAGVVATASAMIYYASQSNDQYQAILESPLIPKTLKALYLAKSPLTVVGIASILGIAAYLYLNRKKA
jgi:hypothetical protein